jgi:hypothetical protein
MVPSTIDEDPNLWRGVSTFSVSLPMRIADMRRHGARARPCPRQFPVESPASAGSFPFRTPTPLYGCVSSQARLKTCTGADVRARGEAPVFLTSEALPARRHYSRNAKIVGGTRRASCNSADDPESRLEFEASLHSNGRGVHEREGSA